MDRMNSGGLLKHTTRVGKMAVLLLPTVWRAAATRGPTSLVVKGLEVETFQDEGKKRL
jgi:hypothetical protein